MNRRSILKLIGAAPVAAPVVAREAAQKAAIGTVGIGVDDFASPSGYSGPSPVCQSERDWITGEIKRVFTKAWEDEQRAQSAGWYPTRLDPDLASSRSLSLSAAVRMQRDRNIERDIRRERENLKRSYLRIFGFEFLG